MNIPASENRSSPQPPALVFQLEVVANIGHHTNMKPRRKNTKNTLLMLLFVLGLSCQAFAQAPAKDFAGTWQGTLEAGGQKLRLVVTVTKSEAGAYSGKLDSVDQGATVPI